ncbi:hypothetical protein AG74_209 [Vibrio phage AG74]|uniref:Uncharacterized protein n=1 Tax=Vibrio phage AG74 TaxID=2736261 RepID=A0A6M9Z0T1_9CAUD|nr:hypothetical protein KNV06_gp098 [Vibrio phage AG74]QKN85045.1 hypothetical protein AG74_209 [Vibrio phage AG74]
MYNSKLAEHCKHFLKLNENIFVYNARINIMRRKICQYIIRERFLNLVVDFKNRFIV